jgi:hypothetical protein
MWRWYRVEIPGPCTTTTTLLIDITNGSRGIPKAMGRSWWKIDERSLRLNVER